MADDVIVIEDARATAVGAAAAPATAPAGDDGDDEVTALGARGGLDLPHARCHCPAHAFGAGELVGQLFPYGFVVAIPQRTQTP